MKLDDWLHAKGDLLEWPLKLRKNATCQANTKHMEDELFACPNIHIVHTYDMICMYQDKQYQWYYFRSNFMNNK